MKNLMKVSVLAVLFFAVIVSSCKEDADDNVEPKRQTDEEFQTLISHLQSENLDIDGLLNGWITTASDVNDNLSNYYVIDIRKSDDYNSGHIPGAVNSSLGDILTTAQDAGDKTIVVACYTGQSAGHAVTALRLSGYKDAKVLKWGMSGWNSTLSAPWESNTGNAASDGGWVDSPGSIVEATEEYDDPDITETGTGAEILEARVNALLSNGFNGVVNADVLGDPGAYFVNNYWASEDVEHYGNITGAYRIKPLTLSGGEYKKLDPESTVVTYCWTGQTSSMLTAYLHVLGYDAVSLKFGANGMVYDNLESHKWSTPSTDLTIE
jgi:rhodanese-related sulfurtransferase